MPNFVLLDTTVPDIARLVTAMVQARDAVESRPWWHPQEPTSDEWWADVLADPRARKRERRTDLIAKQAFYRLADEKRETILVACSKCDWRAAFARDDLIATHGADYPMPNLLNQSRRTRLSEARLDVGPLRRSLRRRKFRRSSAAVATNREGHRQPR